jgi:adenylyltransferase/sulfurtransferase
MLTPEQQLRYARHLTLPGFGPEGQEKLLRGSVLVVGAGGLGSPVALYLAAAGVGRIGVVDDDVVELSNLQRQVLHRTRDVGTPKVESARRAIAECNPEVRVTCVRERFTHANARALVRQHDVVVDCADNFPTRYLVNDAAVLEERPVVHGSIFLFEGQVTVFDARRGPCYRCLFPDPPAPGSVPSCAEAGVMGVLPGVIGTIQATEAVKLLAGLGEPLAGLLLVYDALAMTFRKLRLARNPACALCGRTPSIREVRPIIWNCSAPDPFVAQISAAAYQAVREGGEEHLLLDVREPREVRAGCIEGARFIPLGELARRVGELARWRDRLVVCQCHSGVRSQRAAEFLKQQGFSKVANLSGGYLAWLARPRGGPVEQGGEEPPNGGRQWHT